MPSKFVACGLYDLYIPFLNVGFFTQCFLASGNFTVFRNWYTPEFFLCLFHIEKYMKRKSYSLALVVLISSIIAVSLSACKPTQKTTAASGENKISYATEIAPLIQKSCSPCHFPESGKKEPLNTYVTMKEHIGSVINRVELSQSDEKFMPFKMKKAPLTAAEIKVLKDWMAQNMPE